MRRNAQTTQSQNHKPEQDCGRREQKPPRQGGNTGLLYLVTHLRPVPFSCTRCPSRENESSRVGTRLPQLLPGNWEGHLCTGSVDTRVSQLQGGLVSLGSIGLGHPAHPFRWHHQPEPRCTTSSFLGVDPQSKPSGFKDWLGLRPTAARPLPRPACAHSAVFAPDTRRRSAVSGRSLGVRVRGRCGAGHFSAARLAAAPAAARPRAHAGHQVCGGRRWVSALSRASGAEGLVGGYGVR